MKSIWVKVLMTVLILALPVIYALFIEPQWLEVKTIQIEVNGPPTTKRSWKIAQLTDIHSAHLGSLEKRALAAIALWKPDFIAITGDLATPHGSREGYNKILSAIAQLQPPYGIYFVPGNWEHWTRMDFLSQLLSQHRITDLTNKALELSDGFWLLGFDDDPTGYPKIEEVLTSVPKDAFKIGLFHSPQFFDQIFDQIHLSLAGHTHGGQVRLPFWGPLWLPDGSGNYSAGLYRRDSSFLYVSRGIGTSILPIRFNARPEVSFIELKIKP